MRTEDVLSTDGRSGPLQRAGAAPVTINDAYPWGRSFDEYRQMFRLTDDDLSGRIVGCADGPAAFNAEMYRRGGRAVSCDPLYAFTATDIRARIEAIGPLLVARARQEAGRFVWDRIHSPEELGRVRMAAMEEFLADYDAGREEGRYLDRSLPSLGLPDGSFNLALCSHFLLLYSDALSPVFHAASVVEMCRVATEARVFPLLDMNGRRSRHLDGLIEALARHGFEAKVERVDYEFQRGGNEMLRVTRRR
jgi:hypothetical protein